MKGFVFAALFAFVAVQLCHAVPVPDEEKKEDATPILRAATDPSAAGPGRIPEVKSEKSAAEVVAASPETPVKVEEKKP